MLGPEHSQLPDNIQSKISTWNIAIKNKFKKWRTACFYDNIAYQLLQVFPANESDVAVRGSDLLLCTVVDRIQMNNVLQIFVFFGQMEQLNL